MEAILPNIRMKKHQTRWYLGYLTEQLARFFNHLPTISFNEWDHTKNCDHFDFQKGLLYGEVKLMSNLDVLKFCAHQLDYQLGIIESSFPEECRGVLYVFVYRNSQRVGPRFVLNEDNERVDGKRVRLLAREGGTSSHSLLHFLREHLDAVYVVDHFLANAMRNTYGTVPFKQKERYVRDRIRMGPGKFQSFIADPSTQLPFLGMNDSPARWLSPGYTSIRGRKIETRLYGEDFSFPLFALLPTEDRHTLFKEMNGSVQAIV